MHNHISCAELLKFVPDDLLRCLERQTEVNHQVKKLTGALMFKLLLFSLLNTHQVSLRIMEQYYQSDSFKVFAHSGNRPIRHTGIADRLANINWVFFQKIFEHLVERFSPLLTDHRHQLPSLLKVDSTLVGLSAKLLDWGMDRADKSYLKFTFAVKDYLPVEVKMFSKPAEMSEELALKKTILSSKYAKNCLVVFDRGLQKRASFSAFTGQSIRFITRLKSRLNYQVTRAGSVIKGQRTPSLILKQDVWVRLKDENNHWTKKSFRLITATSRLNGEELSFLTNISNLKATALTEIYQRRWEIEIFFKFLKQHLNFKHLISRTKNGVMVMLYATLILSLLLLVYKKINHIASYQMAKLKFLQELDMEIIKEIVNRCGGDMSRFFRPERLYPS